MGKPPGAEVPDKAQRRRAPGNADSRPGAAPVPQYPIESVDNALKLLLLLGERSELRLTEVAEYLGVASSTAHRLLAMLQYRGFMRQDPRTKAYRPGTALTGVAFSILQRFDVRDTLHPFLEKLNRELGETVHLAVLDGPSVQFVDAIESPQTVRVTSRIGRSMPAHCTSSGKVLLAHLSTEELRHIYPQEELEGLTRNSIRSRSALERELAAISRRGYATSTEESEEGVRSVAVAFPPRRTHMRLALNAALPASRMAAAGTRQVADAVRATVAEAAELLH